MDNCRLPENEDVLVTSAAQVSLNFGRLRYPTFVSRGSGKSRKIDYVKFGDRLASMQDQSDVSWMKSTLRYAGLTHYFLSSEEIVGNGVRSRSIENASDEKIREIFENLCKFYNTKELKGEYRG